MKKIISLKELKREYGMDAVQVRLPKEIREQAKKIASSESSNSRKLTEADVYRTAILFFLSTNSTDSSETKKARRNA
jgi:hypothetical protein